MLLRIRDLGRVVLFNLLPIKLMDIRVGGNGVNVPKPD